MCEALWPASQYMVRIAGMMTNPALAGGMPSIGKATPRSVTTHGFALFLGSRFLVLVSPGYQGRDI